MTGCFSGGNVKIRKKIEQQIHHLLDHTIIVNRKYLDDEQLTRREQFAVLREIFNEDVRDREIRELSTHFAPVLRNDHPIHLSILGKTGTGKTVTARYFLALLQDICQKKVIAFRYAHLDLTTPRPCFRALNDLACLLDASKRYQKGISLDELMGRIEDKLADYPGYLVLFIDEVDNVRRDLDSFLKFLVKRLPQKVPAKLILVFVSNRLNWMDPIDPRIRSFLKINELIFKPYDAMDLLKILAIRVKRSLNPSMLDRGVMEKIAACSSRDHGDARKAVELLTRSAQIAEKAGTRITLATIDQANEQIEQDQYVALIRCSPKQLQAVLYAILSSPRAGKKEPLYTGEAYEAYRSFCEETGLRPLTQRAFSDLVTELDMYGFIRAKIISKGRYGRTKEIGVGLSEEVVHQLKECILLNFDLKGKREVGK